MNETNTWYKDIEKKISSLKEKMDKESTTSYDLDLFLRMAKRVTEYSPNCEECNNIQRGFESALNGMAVRSDATAKQKGDYIAFTKDMLKHLKTEHHIVRSKEGAKHTAFVGLRNGSIPGLICIISSFTVSTVDRSLPLFIGLFLLAVGAPIGTIVGFLKGKSADRKAEQEGRII